MRQNENQKFFKLMESTNQTIYTLLVGDVLHRETFHVKDDG